MDKVRHQHDICWPYNVALREVTTRIRCADKSSLKNASLVQPIPEVHKSGSACGGEMPSRQESASGSWYRSRLGLHV